MCVRLCGLGERSSESDREIEYIVFLIFIINKYLCYIFSLFAILYPTGITGELGCMYMAAVYLRETKVTWHHNGSVV